MFKKIEQKVFTTFEKFQNHVLKFNDVWKSFKT